MTITKHSCVKGLEIKYIMRIIYQLSMKIEKQQGKMVIQGNM